MKTKDIVREEVYTLANELVNGFAELDTVSGGAEFWENVENLWEEGEDSDAKEVYQWWLVSGWLYEKLKSLNAVVCEYMGLHFWGRTECGQGLEYDYDINQVERISEHD